MTSAALGYLRRQYLCVLRRNALLVVGAVLGSGAPVLAQSIGIVPDGRTQTQLNTRGGVTDISTATIRGNTGFNSFSRFNVDAGKTVNLLLPGQTSNLLNLVYGEQSNINGLVNAYKNGAIGGNVFFFNPYGVVVGSTGVINVGSLTIATPTTAFMDKLISPLGVVDDATTAAALAGNIPLSASGLVLIKGRVNATEAITLAGDHVEVANGASMVAGPMAQVAFGDLVNLGGFASASQVQVNGGIIRILAAKDIKVAGQVSVDGTSHQTAGKIDINAGGDLQLLDGANISADGQGEAAHAGTVHMWASGSARLDNGALVSARGGKLSGNGGAVELSAHDKVTLAGGVLRADATSGNAGSVLIDPTDIEVLVNVATAGSNYDLLADKTITVAEGVEISTRNGAQKAGNLTLKASHIELKDGVKLLADGDSAALSGDVTLSASEVNIIGADRAASASVKLSNATVRGHNIVISSDADTSFIARALEKAPKTTAADLQKLVDNEVAKPSDGPGVFSYTITTTATATTEIYGSNIVGSGRVTISSSAAARAGFKKTAVAQTLIGDSNMSGNVVATTITGNAVTIESKSNTSFVVDAFKQTLTLLDQSGLPSPDDSRVTVLDDTLFDYTSVPLVAMSKSHAKVTINGATQITADTIDIHSAAESFASPHFSSWLLGSAAWGTSDANATMQVLGNTQLTSTHETTMTASTEARLDVTADLSSVNTPVDVVFVHADNTSVTLAETGSATKIRAGTVELAADTKADLNVIGKASNMGGSGLGIAVVVNQSSNTVEAKLGGNVVATSGDVIVAADIDIIKNTTIASAKTLGNPSTYNQVNNLLSNVQLNAARAVAASSGLFSHKVSAMLMPGLHDGKLDISGAMAYTDSTNSAKASIAASATVKASGGVDVASQIKDRPTASAGATSKSTGDAIGGAMVLASFNNHADASLATGSTVDAAEALSVDAKTTIPYGWDFDWSSPEALAKHLLDNQQALVLTTYSINSAIGKDGVGAAVGVTRFKLNNTSDAHIDKGVKVNSNPGTGNVDLSLQTVDVRARNEVDSVNAVGTGYTLLGTGGGKAAVGGSLTIVEETGSASATIRGNTEVHSAKTVTVQAESVNRLVSIAEAGGSSDKVGIEGAVSINSIKNNTLAAIDDDAKVDAGGSVTVSAKSDVKVLDIAGGIVSTKGPIGIGFSVALNHINTETKAYVGNLDPQDTLTATGHVATDAAITVTAESKTAIGSYALAGAIATTSSAQTVQPGSDDASTPSGSSGGSSGKFGIAVSGDASVNEINANTRANLSDGANVSRAGDVTLLASNALDIRALSGAVTISTQQNGSGLTGSYASNTMTGTTEATVTDASIQQTGSLAMTAKVTGDIRAMSASLDATSGKAGVAGAVSINSIANTANTSLVNSAVGGGLQNLSLTTEDSVAIESVAGALAYGGKAGIGLSFAWNKIDNTTSTDIANGDVDAAGSVSLSATTSNSIESLAAALGASKGQMAAAASLAINTITTQTRVRSQDSSWMVLKDVNLLAEDSSAIKAYTGSAALTEKATLGAAGSYNHLGGTTLAEVRGGDISSATGSVSVEARHSGKVTAAAISGAGAQDLAFAGSVAINDLGGSTIARITGAANVHANNNLVLSAQDDEAIAAFAGSVALSQKIGIGGAVALSDIHSDTTAEVSGNGTKIDAGGSGSAAQIDGGTLTSSDSSATLVSRRKKEAFSGVAVVAASTYQVDSIVATGAIADKAGVVASASVIQLGGTTTAQVTNQATVNATAAARVAAYHHDQVIAKAGSLALSGNGAVGGAADSTILSHATTAKVDAATVGARDAVTVDAASGAVAQQWVAGVSLSGKVGVAGSTAVLLVNGSTSAGAKNATLRSSKDALRIAATSALSSNPIVGSASVSGQAAVGASVIVAVVDQATTASVIGASHLTADTAVVLAAVSRQALVSYAPTAALSGSLGVAGTVVVTEFKGSTEAVVGGTSTLVQTRTDSGAQGVSVSADQTGTIDNKLGGLTLTGSVSLGAVADVVLINNNATAKIAGTAVVTSGRDILVKANNTRNIDSLTLAGALSGDGAISGAVSYVSAGAGVDSNASSQVSGSVAYANNQSANSAVGTQANEDDTQSSASVDRSNTARATIDVSHDLSATPSRTTTQAVVDAGTQLTSGGSVKVLATTQTDTQAQAAGGAIAGTVALGGGAAVVKIADVTLASVSGTVKAADGMTIKATDQHGDPSFAIAYAGGIGEVGLGASFAQYTVSSTTTATIGNNAKLDAQGEIVLDAGSNHAFSAQTLNAVLGLYAGLGAAVANSTENSEALASIGNDVAMTGSRLNAHSSNVSDSAAASTAAAGGAAAGSAAVAQASANASSKVTVGTNDSIVMGSTDVAHAGVVHAINFNATSNIAASSYATGLDEGLVAAGAVISKTSVKSDTETQIGAGNFTASSIAASAAGNDTLLSKAVSGAGGLGAVVAAQASNTSNAITTAKMAGTLHAADVSINARYATDFQGTANSVMASALGFSGAQVSNASKATTRAELADNSKVTAEAFSLIASSTVTKGAANADYAVRSASGGVLNGASGSSATTINNDTSVVVGAGAKVAVAKENAEGTLTISASNDIKAYDGVLLDTGGVIAVAVGASTIDVNSANANVILGAGALLQSDGDVNVESSTKADVVTETQVKTYGMAGAPVGRSRSKINTTNSVALNGARIESDESVRIVAGANNALNASAETYLWNKTVSPINTKPEADGQITQNNSITIAATGISTTGIADPSEQQIARAAIAAVKDITLNAGAGSHVTHGYGSGTDLYREVVEDIAKFFGQDVSLDIKGGSTSDNSRSSAQVDGTLFAGTHHAQYLTVSADGKTVTKSDGMGYSTRDGVLLADVYQGQIDYLHARYLAYKDTDSDVANGFLNDENILSALQAKLPAGSTADFIYIKPAAAYTGNITVNAEKLTGTGELLAPGDSSIKVTNNSNRYVVVESGNAAGAGTAALYIPGEQGGLITLNGARVSSAQEISSRNKDGATASFSAMQDRITSYAPQIVLKNTSSGGSGISPEIHVEGDISNSRGLVKIQSTGTVLVASNITAQTVDIATQGDFIKTFTLGFTHTAGDPAGNQTILNADQTATNHFNSRHPTDPNPADAGETITDHVSMSVAPSAGGSTIAGNNVFISGQKLNINGTIQSGIADFTVNIDAAAVSAAKTGNGAWVALDANDANSPQIRWDAVNARVELGNVQVQGGYMQLYGDLFSTGNGKLNVMDGYGRINVNNTSTATLALNRLDTGSGVAGIIKLIDTSTKTSKGTSLETTITRENGRVVYAYNDTTSDGFAPSVSGADERSATYNTRAQRRLTWTTGTVNAINTVEHYYKLCSGNCATELNISHNGGDFDPDQPPVLSNIPSTRLQGELLTQYGQNYVNTNDYILEFKRTTSATRFDEPVKWSTYSKDDLGIVQHERKYATVDSHRTDTDTYNHSLNASKAIAINFMGYDSGALAVTNSSSALQLQGVVRNTVGTTTLVAQSIQADAQAQLVANNLVLTATSGSIGKPHATDASKSSLIKIGLMPGGVLTATATADIGIQQLSGDLPIGRVTSSGKGLVELRADANILGTHTSGVDIAGGSIRLHSYSGGIGSTAKPITMDAGASGTLEAHAANDIAITQNTGDMRILRVESSAGDVALQAKTGSILDLNSAQTVDIKTKEQLLAIAARAGLMDADSASASLTNSISAYNAQQTQAYLQYWQMRGLTKTLDANGKAGYTTQDYNPKYSFVLSTTEAQQFKTQNGWSDADIATYQQQRTAAYHAGATAFGKGDGADFNAKFSYDVASMDVATKNFLVQTGRAWTASQVSNRVAAGIFKDTADTVVQIEPANVVGKNITLAANAGGIGAKNAPRILSVNPDTWSEDDRLALLAAEPADVKLGYNAQTKINEITINSNDDVDVTLLNKGVLTATANKAVYLGSESDIRIRNVTSATGDVRVKTGAALLSAAAKGVAAVTGTNITLEAGGGDLGEVNTQTSSEMVVQASGTIAARANGSIYLTQIGDLVIDQVYAKDLAKLSATGAILEANHDTLVDVHAQNIVLTAGSTVGANGAAIDLNVDPNGWVDIAAVGGAYINSPERELVLRNVTANEFTLESAHELSVSGTVATTRGLNINATTATVKLLPGAVLESEQSDIHIVAKSLATATGSAMVAKQGNVTVEADDIVLQGKVSAGQMITLVAAEGDLTQTGGSLNSGGSTTLSAVKGNVTLDGTVASVGALKISAGNAIAVGGGGGGTAPQLSTDGLLDARARKIQVKVMPITHGKVVSVNIGGPNGTAAQDIELDVVGAGDLNILDFNVARSAVRTDSINLNLEKGHVGDYATFATPLYSVRIDHLDHQPHDAQDVSAFTQTGDFGIFLTADVAKIDAIVLRQNPQKLVSGSVPGSVEGAVGDALRIVPPLSLFFNSNFHYMPDGTLSPVTLESTLVREKIETVENE